MQAVRRCLSSSDVPRVVRVVSFDAMNTMISPKEPIMNTYSRIAKKHGVTVSSDDLWKPFINRMKHMSTTAPCFGHNKMGSSLWWKYIIVGSIEEASTSRLPDDLATVISDDIYGYFSLSDAWTLVDPNIKTCINKLKHRGLKTVVMSNFDPRLKALLSQMGLHHLFDMILLSGELGMEKPDERLFELVRNHFHLDSNSEILHIGDDLKKDYLAAKSCGAKAMLFDPSNSVTSVSEIDKISTFSDLSIY